MRVLVVDDEATLARNIARMLSRNGFKALTAANVGDARQLLSQQGVDALCLDILLPDGDGLDFLEEIRANKSDVPVVVISSHVSAANRNRARRLGAKSILSKPFDMKRLLQAFSESGITPNA